MESSCVRRKRGLGGLHVDEHAMVRVAGPLTATETAYYFSTVQNGQRKTYQAFANGRINEVQLGWMK